MLCIGRRKSAGSVVKQPYWWTESSFFNLQNMANTMVLVSWRDVMHLQFCFFFEHFHLTAFSGIYRYLFGMYAFGLEETNFYDKAEKTAKRVTFVCYSSYH